MRRLVFLFLLLLFHISIQAQEFAISFPTFQAVFQRDVNNNGFIPVAGNFVGQIDRIEGRLVPVRFGQGVQTDWQLIQSNPVGGYFHGKVLGKGGWYQLEVRFVRSEVVQRVVNLSRVGLGEVFLVGGQSNAQGLGVQSLTARAASDERVVSVNALNQTDNFDNFDILPFSQTQPNEIIAPGGGGPWCWGELGEMLAARLNVPVAFFNGAWGGMEYYKWVASINGKRVENAFGELPEGQPYANMKYMGQFYGSLYGFRAMLWLQGEGNKSTLPADYSAEIYANAIQQLFDRFRLDLGKNVGVVMARTSLISKPGSTIETIAGQELLINKVNNNVFRGPFTDTIQVNRFDGTHFSNRPGDQGLTKLAKAWDGTLDERFFQQCKPFSPAEIVPVSNVRCTDGFNAQATIDAKYVYQRWSNGSKNKGIPLGNSYVYAILRDGTGNAYATPRVLNSSFRPTTRPQVTIEGRSTICDNETTTLIATGNYKSFRWNTNDTTSRLTIKRTGEYAAFGVNEFGCLSIESNSIDVTVIQSPPKPTIIPSGSLNFCDGGSVTLSGPVNMSQYNWSSGATSRSLNIRQSGSFSLSVTDQNGCKSPVSNPLAVNVLPNPPKPLVQQVGTYSLGTQIEATPQTIDSYTWYKNQKEESSKTDLLKVRENGIYAVQVNRTYSVGNQRFTCRSINSDNFELRGIDNIFFPTGFSIYPNPAPDGFTYIETKEDLTDVIVYVYNQLGQLVHSQLVPVLVTRQKVNLSKLQPGMYFMKLLSNGKEYKGRVLVE
jgi:Carbohydrate esterase, sialic acid-specific acetylesterase/Secretion system C-terminal sorting domain